MLCHDLATMQSLKQAFRDQRYDNEQRENTQRYGRIFQRVDKPNHDSKQATQDTEKDQEALQGTPAYNPQGAKVYEEVDQQ